MKNNKTIIKLYLQEIEKELICSNSIKKAFIHEIKLQIAFLEERTPDLTLEDLYREIGSPAEIAKGLETREDIENLKKKARRYTHARILWAISALLVLCAIVATIIVVHENDTYYSETTSTSSVNFIN